MYDSLACTEKLRDNVLVELTFERAGEDDVFYLPDFLEAVEINTSVRRVSFSGTFARSLIQNDNNNNNNNNNDNNTWSMVLSNIGKLQNLQELQIWCSTIPLEALGRMLSHAKNLRKLYLFRVQFQGASFQPVCDALRGGRTNEYHALEDLRLAGFGGGDDTHGQPPPPPPLFMDDLLEALAETNHLRVLHIQQNHPAPAPFGKSSFQAILTSNVLNELYLSRIGLESSHLQVLVEALPQSQLRMLNLFGNEIPNVAEICRSLEHQATLETLILPCCCASGNVEQQQRQLDQDQLAIANLIQVNTTLQNLHLPKSEFTDRGIAALAEALTINTTLRKCEIGVAENDQCITQQSVQAIQNMLEQNYGLQKLIVKNLEMQQLAEFYSKLNGLGRAEILQTNDVRDWIEAITKITTTENDDDDDHGLDALYYFVRSNPGFLCHTNQTAIKSSFPHRHRQQRRVKRQHSLCFIRQPPTASRSFVLSSTT
jgi:hypothetical protein